MESSPRPNGFPARRETWTRSCVRALAAGIGASACAAALATAGTEAAPKPVFNGLSLVPVAGTQSGWRFWIDADSVRSEGEILHYRLHGASTEDAGQSTYEAEVGVRCDLGTRVEYVSTTRWPGGVRTSTEHRLHPVAPGSHAAVEMEAACLLASRGRAGGTDIRPTATSARPAASWSGTAFAVTPQIVITNHHVVRHCPDVRVVHEGRVHAAQVVAADQASDLAAIVVPAAAFRPLAVAAASQQLGDAVSVLGFPLTTVLGDGLRVTTGIVSALSGFGGDSTRLQISAPVNAGNSGGPVLDEAGAVAGVVVGKLDARLGVENVSFAIRAEQLHRFIAANRLPVQPGLVSKPGRNLGERIRMAAPSVVRIRCARPEELPVREASNESL